MSTSLSEGVRYLFVLGATSKSTGLSRGDDAPGGSWGTGLSTMVLRCCTGELSLMDDCESCLLRADMAFVLLRRLLRLQFSTGARDGGRTCAMYSVSAGSERQATRTSLAWKADYKFELA